MKDEGITLEELSNFILTQRIENNIPPGGELPPEYESRATELIFSGAFPTERLNDVLTCAQRR